MGNVNVINYSDRDSDREMFLKRISTATECELFVMMVDISSLINKSQNPNDLSITQENVDMTAKVYRPLISLIQNQLMEKFGINSTTLKYGNFKTWYAFYTRWWRDIPLGERNNIIFHVSNGEDIKHLAPKGSWKKVVFS